MASGSNPNLYGLNGTERCNLCTETLFITSETGEQIIDDIELPCNHHFHWACVLEYADAQTDAKTRSSCPTCQASVLNGEGKFIVTVRNEGGISLGFDLGEVIEEEAFLEDNPAARRTERFLALLAEQDHRTIEEMLKGEDEGSDGEKMNPNVAYPDGVTGLHIAASQNDTKSLSLLLSCGADRNARTSNGSTPLDSARAADAGDAVAFLVQ